MTVLVTALATGVAALALTGWMRAVARSDSAWLGSGAHTLLAGFGGAGAAALATGWAELVGFAALALACSLLVVIDLAAHRLPDVIVGPTSLLLLAALTLAAATGDQWAQLGRAAAAAAALAVGYFVLAFINPSGLGLGDVKLAGLLGCFLGWLGWPHVLLGTLAAFILGGLVAAALLLSGKATRHTSVAFGPSMVAGAALGAAWGPAALTGVA